MKNPHLETLRKQLELRENIEILSKRRKQRTSIPLWLKILGAVLWISLCLLQLHWHPETDRFWGAIVTVNIVLAFRELSAAFEGNAELETLILLAETVDARSEKNPQTKAHPEATT